MDISYKMGNMHLEAKKHLGPEEPLEVGGLIGLGQAEAVVDRHQLELAAVEAREAGERQGAVARAAHQDVARVAVGVPDADVQDADAVHVSRRKARRPHLARVTIMVHVLLRRAALYSSVLLSWPTSGALYLIIII